MKAAKALGLSRMKENKEKEPPKEYIEGYIWCDKNQNNFTDGVLRYGQNEIYSLLEFTQYAIGKIAKIEVSNRTNGNLLETKSFKITSKKMIIGFDEEKIFNSCDGETINFFAIKMLVENQFFYPDPKYLNMNLKIHFVVLVPKIMNKLGWKMAEKSQIEWFEGKANNYPWESEPGINYFTLGGLMHFDRFKDFYNKHLNDWKTEKSINVLKGEIIKMQKDGIIEFPTVANPKTEFGTFSGEVNEKVIKPDELNGKETIEKMPLFEKYYFKNVPYKESKLNSLDDFFGAIANCNLRFSAKGFLHYQNGKIMVEIKKIAVYIKDGFDFVDGDALISQPLGFWTYKNKSASKTGFSNSEINNKSYRDYRYDTHKGSDGYRYSNLYLYDATYTMFNLK
ncbi:DUF6402 family protein [Epilithonimonas zeae]|uniref:DUF6402 family protein n=1 Tax=Epilithonimonas zeae TaxID=1416779 RepID=UPI00200C01B1|nr:DUF6402 family protein [Epilithonimonas zeae]UQB68098.1 hypothetical protein KI430_13820 [Epilithonimonas zeae]